MLTSKRALAAFILAQILGFTSSASAEEWKPLAGMHATAMTASEMGQVQGTGITLADFLKTATQTNLGGGVVLYNLGAGSVIASWNTGTTSGSHMTNF